MAFNKMFVMIPLMLVLRKLNAEDPNTVFLLRCAYFTVQSVILLLVGYIYVQAASMAEGPDGKKVVYVPPPPQPFADPNAKKKYTQTPYGLHTLTTARNLLGSTLFGMAITLGLHFYKGIAMGLAMQCVMGPLSLIENPLAKYYLLKHTGKLFDEKTGDELAPDDEIVDASGNPIQVQKEVKNEEERKKEEKTFEDVLLDTWDLGAEADIAPLMSVLTEQNVNFRTAESEWTPIMIMSGLGAKGSASALRQMISMGADPQMVDGEGWNALHWAAFHGSADAAKVLLAEGGIQKGLHLVKDKEERTPLDHAEAEGNDAVAKLILKFVKEAQEEMKGQDVTDEGLRRRKKEEN